MKVTAACDKAFAPIVLTITIQSQAELDNIENMARMNVTIPLEVARRCDGNALENSNTIKVVYEFLNGIAKALEGF